MYGRWCKCKCKCKCRCRCRCRCRLGLGLRTSSTLETFHPYSRCRCRILYCTCTLTLLMLMQNGWGMFDTLMRRWDARRPPTDVEIFFPSFSARCHAPSKLNLNCNPNEKRFVPHEKSSGEEPFLCWESQWRWPFWSYMCVRASSAGEMVRHPTDCPTLRSACPPFSPSTLSISL